MVRQAAPLLGHTGIMAMPSAEDMKNIVENILSSYEMRIQSIGAIFDTTDQLLQSFQESFLDTRLEREKISDQLRECLARNESLRKKDFDCMMHEILSIQDTREKEVRELLNGYLAGQKEMAHSLRDNLAKVKNALAKEETQRVREFQTVIKDILAKQEERKLEAVFKLEEFQKGQHEMAKRLKELLAKGSELRIKDLKAMFAEFTGQHKEQTARQKEQKRDAGYTENMAQKRVDSQPAVSVSA